MTIEMAEDKEQLQPIEGEQPPRGSILTPMQWLCDNWNNIPVREKGKLVPLSEVEDQLVAYRYVRDWLIQYLRKQNWLEPGQRLR